MITCDFILYSGERCGRDAMYTATAVPEDAGADGACCPEDLGALVDWLANQSGEPTVVIIVRITPR